MKLPDIYADGRFGLSFELFPPKSKAGEIALCSHVEKLVKLSPSFITCTYGAGGSTQDKTLKVISDVKRRFGVPVASHVTCVGSTRGQLVEYLAEAQNSGVDYIVALRGDPPRGETKFQPVANGLSYANELVSLIKSEFPAFGIAVAGYPEKHQEAPSMEVDLENLRRKVRCGADAVITQLFYINDDFYRFRQRCEQLGIDVPIIPGLLPVTNLSQIDRIATLCAATLPTDFVNELGKHDDPDWQSKVGIEFAIRQVQDLLNQGVAGLHFYVLNKSEATSTVAAAVNLPVSASS